MIKWRCKKCYKKNAKDAPPWRCEACGAEHKGKGIGAPLIVFKPGFREHYETIDEGDRLEAELPDGIRR